MTPFVVRRANESDVPSIAKLHADNWRRHYRGAYSDHYLGGDLDIERRRVWTKRLQRGAGGFTLLAEDDARPLGFIHVRPGADPRWGSLIDNLHVGAGCNGRGIGTRLLDAAARALLLGPHRMAGVFLWVLEQNTDAQAFYLSRGGRFTGRDSVDPPSGDPRNLNGDPGKLRVVWEDPRALLSSAWAWQKGPPT
jgi:ribosomal protein S18 acetylase RimI-like enzyme